MQRKDHKRNKIIARDEKFVYMKKLQKENEREMIRESLIKRKREKL